MDSNKSVKQLTEDIIKNDLIVKSLIKQIWDCETTNDDLNELNLLVAKHVRHHKCAIDELIAICNQVIATTARNGLNAEIDAFRSQLEANAISLRKAIASSRKVIANQSRELLMNGDSDGVGVRQRNAAKVNKEVLANKSSEITENLQTVSRMLASQVTQSEQTLLNLIGSSATITENQEEFKTMGSVIIHSRKLLTKYGRREITDKVLIILALAFFFACVLYVMMKRLFWR